MKQRFSTLDVQVIAHELSAALSTLRVSNVYDLSSRVFLIKFAKPDRREQLLIDCGFRCHLTRFARSTATAPSTFVARLRKYLRTRRVTGVSQVGTDRIIRLEFSDGQYSLFLEFYAGGNIILTDKELSVLAIWRAIAGGSSEDELRVGLKYGLIQRQNYGGIPDVTKERVATSLLAAGIQNPADGAKKSGSSKKAGAALRRALAQSFPEYPPTLVDHACALQGFDTNLRPDQVIDDDEMLDRLVAVLKEAQRLSQEIMSSDICTGYIIAKPSGRRTPGVQGRQNIPEGGETPAPQDRIYEDFHPFQPRQFETNPDVTLLPFEGFNRTVDEFFSSIEAQKLESRLLDREESAKKKLEAAKHEHQKRLGGLQSIQELNVRKAQAIEANVERVEEATNAVNGLIAQGMDWVEIARLIEMEQSRHNPVAEMIKLPLKLYENTATLLLGETNDADDYEGDSTDSGVSDNEDEATTAERNLATQERRLAIDIDLALSPWANARQYYDQKRSAAVKEQKTIQSSSKALKSTEKKIASDLRKGLKQEKDVLRPVRSQFWFEKFLFFVSSDGYLALGGNDLQQNEILYKRHLKLGDVYVHADIEGAISIVIKNKPQTPTAPIPPSTLTQAGSFSVATSKAWDSKAGMSAWWVQADQVSKTGPTGDFLPVGSFTIKGTKNFLPPAQLLLGFGVMFQISEDSIARHVKHRVQMDPVAEDITLEPSTAEAETDLPQPDTTAQDDDPQENERDNAKFESEADSEDEDRVQSEDEIKNPLQTSHGLVSVVKETEFLTLKKEVDEDGTPSEGDEEADGHQPLAHAEDEEDGEDAANKVKKEELGTPSTKPGVQPAASRNVPVRGKRGKQKKMANKYANQDDEDRALAMKLLGSTAAQEKAQKEADARKAREAEADFQKKRRREQHQRAAQAGMKLEAQRKATRRPADDGGDDENNATEDTTLTTAPLASFIGTPLPGDELLNAIPVCAPLNALSSYKYKAKLQPGNTKKGKASVFWCPIPPKWTGQPAALSASSAFSGLDTADARRYVT
ncbi:MAG: hypothetical protein M1838_002059 [Thelocarpon superellum]|nr:MAG: hypothetical protein M1838_002059 [Thelocarpon superellum]